jgi:broad specificity phosphatase PhoE
MVDEQLRAPYAGSTAAVLSAPEKRAEETALLIARQTQIADALRDCDFGAWKGRTLTEIGHGDPQGAAAWLADPGACPHGGERIAELLHRIGGWLDHFTQDGHVVAVTHAAVMRAAALHILQAPFAAFWRMDIQPLSTMDLWFNGRFWTLRSLNGQAEPDRTTRVNGDG